MCVCIYIYIYIYIQCDLDGGVSDTRRGVTCALVNTLHKQIHTHTHTQIEEQTFFS